MGNRERFAEEYTKALTECVLNPKHDYIYGIDQVATVAAKMIKATFEGTANYDGPVFRLTCKRLGIKATNKSINDFVRVK